jgi:hypothetical protein
MAILGIARMTALSEVLLCPYSFLDNRMASLATAGRRLMHLPRG